MRRGSRSQTTSRNASGANTPHPGSSSNSSTPTASGVSNTRGNPSMRLVQSVPPDVIRSTILSLVSQLRIPDDKRRSLVVEVQQSDFNQSSVVEYFIGVVGVAQYEAALSEIAKRPFGGAQSIPEDPNNLQTSTGDKGKLLAKIYCHGGDVAFFGDIDLEFESQINKALLGYSSSSQKKRRISQDTLGGRHIPDLSFPKIEQAIKRLVTKRGPSNSSSYTFNPRYVASIQRCLGLMLTTILQLTSDVYRAASLSNASSDLITLDSIIPKTSKSSRGINLTHLLTAIQTMMSGERLPINLTRDWEPLMIEKLAKLLSRVIKN